MPNGKTIAAAIVILGIVVGLVFLSGVAPPFLASIVGGQAPVSISQVNLTQGGTAQGQYLVNTAWDIVLNVRVPQTVSLVLNGKCASSNCASTSLSGTFNGAPVNATSQLYVTISPGQPIAWVQLSGQSGNWAQSASSSDGCPTVTSPSEPLAWCAVNAAAQGPINVFSGSDWSYRYPVTITVQKVGGGDAFTASQSIDVLSDHSVTITNPNDPSESVSLSGLGANIGAQAPPCGGGCVVSSFEANGQWYAFATGPSSIFQEFNNYWYNGQQGVSQSYSSPDPSYNSPGWQQLEVSPPPWWCIGCASGGYWYVPIAPSIYGSQSSNSQSWTVAVSNFATVPATFTTNAGQGLIPWLQSNYGFNPYLENVGSGISVNSTTLQVNLPTNVFQPTVQLLASTNLVDTVIYQQNNAQFKITGIQAPSSLANGQTGTINVTLQDTSSFQGTAAIDWTQNPNYINLQPNSQEITLQAGQSGTVTFNVLGSCPQNPGTDTVTFSAINGVDQTTSSSSVGIVLSSASTTICTGYGTSTTSTTPPPPPPPGGLRMFLWVGIGIVGAAAVGLVVYYFKRR